MYNERPMKRVEYAPQMTPFTWIGRMRPKVSHGMRPRKSGKTNLVDAMTPTVGKSISQKSPHRSHCRIRSLLTSASLRTVASTAIPASSKRDQEKRIG